MYNCYSPIIRRLNHFGKTLDIRYISDRHKSLLLIISNSEFLTLISSAGSQTNYNFHNNMIVSNLSRDHTKLFLGTYQKNYINEVNLTQSKKNSLISSLQYLRRHYPTIFKRRRTSKLYNYNPYSQDLTTNFWL